MARAHPPSAWGTYVPQAAPNTQAPGRKHAQGEDIDGDDALWVAVVWGTTPRLGAITAQFFKKKFLQSEKLWGHHSPSKVQYPDHCYSEFCVVMQANLRLKTPQSRAPLPLSRCSSLLPILVYDIRVGELVVVE